jgi:hypothetical protein
MYAVVGCDECSALWIVEGTPETSGCPRCGRTRQHEKRKQFVTTEDEDHAREVRASMLAARQGQDDAFAKLDSFAELETQLADSGIDDETYLEESGVDVDAVRDATTTESGGSQSPDDIVRDAVRSLQNPTTEAVIEYATDHGVSPDDTQKVLEKLVRAGEAMRNDGVYRLV